MRGSPKTVAWRPSHRRALVTADTHAGTAALTIVIRETSRSENLHNRAAAHDLPSLPMHHLASDTSGGLQLDPCTRCTRWQQCMRRRGFMQPPIGRVVRCGVRLPYHSAALSYRNRLTTSHDHGLCQPREKRSDAVRSLASQKAMSFMIYHVNRVRRDQLRPESESELELELSRLLATQMSANGMYLSWTLLYVSCQANLCQGVPCGRDRCSYSSHTTSPPHESEWRAIIMIHIGGNADSPPT